MILPVSQTAMSTMQPPTLASLVKFRMKEAVAPVVRSESSLVAATYLSM